MIVCNDSGLRDILGKEEMNIEPACVPSRSVDCTAIYKDNRGTECLF